MSVNQHSATYIREARSLLKGSAAQGVPRYVYSYMELQKIRFFSKDVKTYAGRYTKLLPRELQRPKLVGKWSDRYSTTLTNRQFKRNWYHKHGNYVGMPAKVHRVYTLRPAGPGPLVKLEKERRQQASGWATAQEHKRVQRGRMPPGSIGPLVAQRPGVYIIPARRTGKTELKRSKGLPTRPAANAAVARYKRAQVPFGGEPPHKSQKEAHAKWLGNKRFLERYKDEEFAFTPSSVHPKYAYFFRKYGTWRFSRHHPYGDERETYEAFLHDTWYRRP
jgi:hypothetical protein